MSLELEDVLKVCFDVPRRIELPAAHCVNAATQTKPASAGWKNLLYVRVACRRENIVLVHGGGLCLCSSELYSPITFKTSSQCDSYKGLLMSAES
jgi:hypothetical protein